MGSVFVGGLTLLGPGTVGDVRKHDLSPRVFEKWSSLSKVGTAAPEPWSKEHSDLVGALKVLRALPEILATWGHRDSRTLLLGDRYRLALDRTLFQATYRELRIAAWGGGGGGISCCYEEDFSASGGGGEGGFVSGYLFVTSA